MGVGNEVVLKVQGVNKTFVLTKAVVDMHLEVCKGEVRGLIGENGSGKSTLSSIIAGSLMPDSGEMSLHGISFRPKSAVEAQNSGISMLVQEAGTIDNLSVAENIFLGNHKEVSSFGFVNKQKMVSESKKILSEIDASNIDPAKLVNDYSFEERKLIEVAKAMHGNPELLILDETTTALSQKGRDVIYNIINKLRDSGKSILFISHDLDELKSICDSVTVMRDGCFISTLRNDEIQIDAMRQLMIGRDLSGSYYSTYEKAQYDEEIVLKVDNISLEKKIKNVSLELHKSEVLGIGGLTNCGMHELCKIMFGLIRPDSGEVRLMQGNKVIKTAHEAADSGMGFIPKDREREGLMTTASITDNIVLMSYNKLNKGPYISRKSERKLVKEQVEKLSIKIASLNQLAVYLSGGNKQKMVIGKWIASGAQVIVMDSPTRGIDIGAKASVYRLIEEFKKEGKSMIMVSEELTELIGMADRILIMKDGEISGCYMRNEGLDEHALISNMI